MAADNAKNTKVLIYGGRVVDPQNGVDDTLDLLLIDGRVARIGKNLRAELPGIMEDVETVDAGDCVVCPGLIDLHVHLRVPREEHKETVATGTLAAVRGGFTTVCCMPNTNPPLHTRAEVEHILLRVQEEGHCRVCPVAAVSMDLQHEQLTEMADLKDAGAIGFSDDGSPVQNSGFLRRAMQYAAMIDMPLILHCEDKGLSEGGMMNEGYVSTTLGLKGIPDESQVVALSRTLFLARDTGCRVHIQHVSTKEEVDLIRHAKADGLSVTAEVCPHHFTLTDEACTSFDSNTKVNPPLRTCEDVAALIEGLQDGTIDCIATDHAPHAQEEKEVEFDAAPFGIVGLETALSLTLLRLVERGHLTLSQAIAKLTCAPAQCLRIEGGHLGSGARADVTIFAPDERWTVDIQRFASLSKNSPFHGWQLPGKVKHTFVAGRSVGGIG